MRNWPYAWALVQGANSRVKDKVGVAPLPAPRWSRPCRRR